MVLPEEHTKEEIVEAIGEEHCVALLPFKPKLWVTCHQAQTLEDTTGLMEAYMSAEADIYLMKNI